MSQICAEVSASESGRQTEMNTNHPTTSDYKPPSYVADMLLYCLQ